MNKKEDESFLYYYTCNGKRHVTGSFNLASNRAEDAIVWEYSGDDLVRKILIE